MQVTTVVIALFASMAAATPTWPPCEYAESNGGFLESFQDSPLDISTVLTLCVQTAPYHAGNRVKRDGPCSDPFDICSQKQSDGSCLTGADACMQVTGGDSCGAGGAGNEMGGGALCFAGSAAGE